MLEYFHDLPKATQNRIIKSVENAIKMCTGTNTDKDTIYDLSMEIYNRIWESIQSEQQIVPLTSITTWVLEKAMVGEDVFQRNEGDGWVLILDEKLKKR